MSSDLDNRLRSSLHRAADQLPPPHLDPAGAVRRGRMRQNRARLGAGLAGVAVVAAGVWGVTALADDDTERVVTAQPDPDEATTTSVTTAAAPVTTEAAPAPEGALSDLEDGWVVVDRDLLWAPAGEAPSAVVSAALTPGHEDLGGYSEQLLLRNVVRLDGRRLVLYEVVDFRVPGQDGVDRLEAYDLDRGERLVVSERAIDTADGSWQYVYAAGVRGDHLGLEVGFHQGACYWLEVFTLDGTPVVDGANPYQRPSEATLDAMAGGDMSGCPSTRSIAAELGLLPVGSGSPATVPTIVPSTTTEVVPPITTTSRPVTTTAPPAPTTTATPATTATTLPGEDFDAYVPEAGTGLAVVGIAWDDVLNVREGPGIGYPVIGTFEPTTVGVVAGGDGRLLDQSIWWSVRLGDRLGWVNSRYVSRVGRAIDITAAVRQSLGDPVVAETGLDLAIAVGRSEMGDEWGETVVVQAAQPRSDGTSEMIVDLVGVRDDAIGTVRLRLVIRDGAQPETVELVSVESTSMCSRGVTPDGICA